MLQLKDICKVLSQGLRPVKSTALRSSSRGPLCLSLLSDSGLPLVTVTDSQVQKGSKLDMERFRLYTTMVASEYLESISHEQEKDSTSNWSGIELEKGLWSIITEVDGEDNFKPETRLLLILFYEDDFPHSIAKLKLDNVCNVLNQELRGYLEQRNANGQKPVST